MPSHIRSERPPIGMTCHRTPALVSMRRAIVETTQYNLSRTFPRLLFDFGQVLAFLVVQEDDRASIEARQQHEG